MREDPNRRNVMATGVALALAAPMSTITPVGGTPVHAEDWPEFSQWLADAIKLDEAYAWSSTHGHTLTREAYRAAEEERTEEMGRLCDVARTLAAKPARTDRQIAMLTTLAIWSAACDFVADRLDTESNDIAEATSARLLMALAPRTAALLPEVPFTFKAEG